MGKNDSDAEESRLNLEVSREHIKVWKETWTCQSNA